SPAGDLAGAGSREIAERARHGENCAADVHLRAGEVELLEETLAHGLAPEVVLASRRPAHARRGRDFQIRERPYQNIVELRDPITAAGQFLDQARICQRAEIHRGAGAALCEELLHRPDFGFANRSRKAQPHGVGQRRICAHEDRAASPDLHHGGSGIEGGGPSVLRLRGFDAPRQRPVGEDHRISSLTHHISMATQVLHMAVRGMTCGNCARTVERTVSGTPGVTKATVNLDASSATVEYDVDMVKPEVLEKAVRELGYEVA